MQALIGRYEHGLDEKNRLFVPSRYREQLAAEGGKHFFLAVGVDKCVSIFLPSQWEAFLTELKAYKFKTVAEKRATMLRFFSCAKEVCPDEQGRIVVPAELKEHAGLRKEALIVGMGTRAEIWDQTSFEKKETQAHKVFDKVASDLDL